MSATPPSAFEPAATTSYDSGAAPNPSFHHSRHTTQRYGGLSSLQISKQKCRLPQMWNRLLADDKSSDVATRGTGSINCLHGEGEEMVCRLSRRAPWLRQTSFCGPIFPSPRQQDYQHLPYLAASNGLLKSADGALTHHIGYYDMSLFSA